MQKLHIFCDFINGASFAGEQKLTPDMLSRLPEGTVLEPEGEKGESVRFERIRDAIFEAAMPGGEHMIFRVILGVENQSFVDYGMVIRDLGYEMANYTEQLKLLKQKRRDEKSLTSGDEYLSGIKREDKLVPVVNFVFYYGEKVWDGSTRLFELLDVPKGEEWVYQYISDYKINLVHAGNVDPKNFKTGLRQVFELLPYSGNAEKLEAYVTEHREEFSDVTEETFDLLATFLSGRETAIILKKKKFQNEKGSGYNMCTAFQQMREEGINQGINQGIKALVEAFKEIGVSREDTRTKLKEKFHLNGEKAEKYMMEYWK